MAVSPSRLDDRMLVELDRASVAFHGTLALAEVSWSWPRGQSVLVVGPSGAGKSTLAMLATGLIPQSVEATVTGGVYRSQSLTRPGAVGYVFQDPDAQFCQIRVGEEVAFGLENAQTPPEQMDARVARALDAVGVRFDLNLEHGTLSGGNKQKLALAAALALDPEVLVLDEPTANLDPASTDEVFSQIGALIRRGVTVMVIEHKFQALARTVPWMVLLDAHGHLYRSGPTARLLAEEAEWMTEQGLLDDPAPVVPTVVPATTPLLTLQGVSARYGRTGPRVLTNITLTVGSGELVALVGANGAGKSSLLKVIAELMPISEGQRRLPAEGAALGFQNPEHQFIFERVVDELANHYVPQEPTPHVRELLRTFRLGDQAQQSPYQLSQGQKRRLSVAVMLERPHPIYCLDEPTFGQDAHTRRLIMDRLAQRQAEGAAVLVSTHDLDLVERWATRVVALEAGRIVFDGPFEELASRPDLMVRLRLKPGAGEDQPAGAAVFPVLSSRVRHSPIGRLNPAWKLLSVFLAAGLTAFAHHLSQAIPLAMVPVGLLALFSGLSWGGLLKRLAPFVLFFFMYVWVQTAYAAVGPHTPVVHLLWYRLSYPGFIDGLVLGFRMLAAVGFGLLFVSTVDLVELVKSLSREFRIPPRLSYGTLAGLRFFPQFRDEWGKLRMARRVRGRDVQWSPTRVVTYALPLLSDAVRLSERVAIAMEARGFRGPAATSSKSRTYYHPAARRFSDAVFGVVLVGLTALALWH